MKPISIVSSVGFRSGKCGDFSRRQLIRALCAGLTASALPFRAHSIADPATLMGAAQAVVAIASKIQEEKTQSGVRQSLADILAKLDVIIANQDTIIRELRELKVFVYENELISWRNVYARAIVGYRERLGWYLAELRDKRWRLDTSLTREFENLAGDCANSTIEIGQMDVWAFPFYATGVAVVMLIDDVLGAPKRRRKETAASFISFLNAWLDPARPRSVPALIAKTQKEVDEKLAALNAAPRSSRIEDRQVRTGDVIDGFCDERLVRTVIVAGSFEAGFTGSVTTEWLEKHCFPPSHERLRPGGRFALREDESFLKRKSAEPTADAAETPPPIPELPELNPSGMAIVDEFNRERISIYEMMQVVAYQKRLGFYMERFRKNLVA